MERTKRGSMRLLSSGRTGWIGVSVPRSVWARETAYVASASGTWSLVWRAARAAWRCARVAARRTS